MGINAHELSMIDVISSLMYLLISWSGTIKVLLNNLLFVTFLLLYSFRFIKMPLASFILRRLLIIR